jgi:carboxypeptidase C (cathepsin A)
MLTMLLGVLLALPAAQNQATQQVAPVQILGPVSSVHHFQIGGVDVAYTAIFEENVLEDSQGRPMATISSTTYLRRDVPDVQTRPVLFAFNGGPGASSSPLHFGAFGPRRIIEAEDGVRSLADNPYSLLADTDLVFIDPVGTGFNQIPPGGDGAPYWSIEGDADAVLDLVRGWLREHGRAGSPLFIAGESYGAFRLANMVKKSNDLNIAGLIVISPMLDASASDETPGNDQPYIFSLPAMAVAAWQHNHVDRAGLTVQQQFEEAARFAQTEYTVALQQGSLLPASDRNRMANRMAALIGLPARLIADSNLRVSNDLFVTELLKDKNLVLGRLDTRVAAPPPPKVPADRPAAASDPALGLGSTNVIKSSVGKTYFVSELGVHTTRDYVSLTLDVNFKWNWQQKQEPWHPKFYTNAAPYFAAYMQKHPQTRLLVVGGYYDLAVPILSARNAISHSGIPLDRVTMAIFESGHSTFSGDASLARMDNLMHSFLFGEKVETAK